MAEERISDFNSISAIADADYFAIETATETLKGSGAQVKDFAYSGVDALDTQASLGDAMTLLLRNGGASEKTTLSLLKQFVDGPVGSYNYFDSDFPNMPVLDSWWVECNGQAISDSDSPFNGYRTRNYNGADVVLTGIVWASGVATIPATDITALAIGDDVSGGAIASDTYISDITGTTVTLTDTAISATVDTTFTNDGRFIRGGAVSGIGKKDALQGHAHLVNVHSGAGTGASSSTYPADVVTGWDVTPNTTNTVMIGTPISDGVNGTTRTDDETRPIYTSQVAIFKIK